MITQSVINHLWQSSCFALLAGLLALVLRGNSPKVRYWIWLSASLKFLVPFALMVSLGSLVPRPDRQPASPASPVFPNTLVQIVQPFSSDLQPTVPVQVPMHWAPVAIGVVWFLGFLIIAISRLRGWLRVRGVLRAGTPVELPIPVRAFVTPGAEEPGIVGFLRPVLVLPRGLVDRLSSQQLGAILTHELCHVRRRDNFFAAVHMAVEAIFWFHPLVWWIGSRMVEERELACDEEVLQAGCEPADYVEGILKVCRFYTESPLPCVSGVTGADVKRRLRAILAGSIARDLTVGKKLVLAAIGLAVVSAPIVIGVLTAPVVRAQNATANLQFEVASVKHSDPNQGGLGHRLAYTPGRYSGEKVSLFGLAFDAYGLKEAYQIEWASPWMASERYDLAAKVPEGATIEQVHIMLQHLLAERFGLIVHHETRQLPGYRLVVAKGGAKLRRSVVAPAIDVSGPSIVTRNGIAQFADNARSGRLLTLEEERLHGRQETMGGLAHYLVQALNTPVIDATGIEGEYDYDLSFAPPDPAPLLKGAIIVSPVGAGTPVVSTSPSPSGDHPTIFAAITEQLGLQLEAVKSIPVEVLVLDKASPDPTEN